MPSMLFATKIPCDFSLIGIPQRSNIQLTIKSMIMNQKQYQMGITGLKLMGGHLIKSQMSLLRFLQIFLHTAVHQSSCG
jgi:hypothetical protein